MWPILIFTLVLLICLFPIWPYFFRLIVFYLSLYLLIIISIFTVIRFIVFYLFRLAGYEFWLLPEIFENDSFRPYYTFKKKKDSKTLIIIRIALVLFTIAYLIFLYFVPSSYEGLGDLLIESYDEVVVWGKDKIAFNYT